MSEERREDTRVVIGGTYRHRKGDLYVVEAVALESTNGRPRERVVIYRGTKGLNVRTEREFLEIDQYGNPRFALLPPSPPPPPEDGRGKPEGQRPETRAAHKPEEGKTR